MIIEQKEYSEALLEQVNHLLGQLSSSASPLTAKDLALRQIEWVGVGCCEAMVPGKEANDGSARAVFSGVRVGSTVVGG